MPSALTLEQLSILISGINVVISIFLLAVSIKASKKGVRLIRYLSAFFFLVLLDSVFIISTYFYFNSFSLYVPSIMEITFAIVMLLFYLSIIRGNKK
jgi:hypothetical protein